MGFLSGLMAFFKALAIGLGMIERNQERATGAALQRGEDSTNELKRITDALDAGNAVPPDGVPADPNDRDAKRG